jgi:hypothetical protein
VKLVAFFFFISLPAFAQIKGEISGNAEIQGRHSWNNPQAKEDFNQRWDEEDFYLGYGNLTGKLNYSQSAIESNLFVRHSRSDLYRNDYAATRFFNFPDKLVARDLFKLQHVHQNDETRDEVILNKLFYQWQNDDVRFTAGRMYINYGLGEIFNPINPFNQPTALTSISQVAQGNDGVGFSIFSSEKHKIDFYLLGDKRFDDYEGKISHTLWIHGELQFTGNFEAEYVLGQDQDRNKAGTQLSYQWDDNLLFFQGLYQTAYISDKQSNNLIDILLGVDRQFTQKWHVRMEAGYQKQNRYLNPFTPQDRFLPTEYFIALANQYEFHPLVKGTLTFINDVKSGFTYGLTRLTLSLSENSEGEIFGYSPVARGDRADNITQKLVTQDVGIAARIFF